MSDETPQTPQSGYTPHAAHDPQPQNAYDSAPRGSYGTPPQSAYGYPSQTGYGYQPGSPMPYVDPRWLQPPPPPGMPPIPDGVDPGFKGKKVSAGVCGILLGTYGVHKFILGYKNEGITMLAISLGGIVIGFIGVLLSAVLIGLPLLVAFAAPSVMQVIGLIEGIMYLTKSDYDFVMMYGVNRKPWF